MEASTRDARERSASSVRERSSRPRPRARAERRAPARRPTSRDSGIMFWRSPGLVQASPVEVRLFADRDDRAIFASVPTSRGARPEARSEQQRDASEPPLSAARPMRPSR